MHQLLVEMVAAFRANAGAASGELEHIVSGFDRPLPQDYLDLLAVMEGGEGFIGDDFFRLYSIAQVLRCHRMLADEVLAGQLLIIGSNGGGEAYALDFRDQKIPLLRLPFIPSDGRNLYEQ